MLILRSLWIKCIVQFTFENTTILMFRSFESNRAVLINVGFENRILRRIFGPKRDENGEWRRLHNEELHSLYRSPNTAMVITSRRLRWAGHVARMEEGRGAFKIWTGKPTGKRPLGRPRCRWEDNIRMDLEEIRGIGLIWLRIGIIGEPLWIWHWTSGFHKPWSELVTDDEWFFSG